MKMAALWPIELDPVINSGLRTRTSITAFGQFTPGENGSEGADHAKRNGG